MRIISGSFKGKKILEPKDYKTRPLKDLTKESIFNIINHSNKFNININESNVLDLFSGVGSFGIECLSRGAKQVVFIENYSGVLKILKRNLMNLKSIENYEVIEQNIYENDFDFKFKKKFNIIFLDPPYKDKKLDIVLTKIENSKILQAKGVIIIHRHKEEKDIFSSNYKVIEEKRYGISKIIFLIHLD